MKKSEQLAKEINELIEERNRLKSEIALEAKSLEKKRERLTELIGSTFSHASRGLIARKIGEHQDAKITELDEGRPHIVLKTGEFMKDQHYVITRVTPKRLYYRKYGATREQFTPLDNKSPHIGLGQIVDIAASVEAFKQHQTEGSNV